MKKLENLLRNVEKDVFTLADASRVGLTRYYLEKLLEESRVYELQKGVFQKSSKKNQDDVQVLSFKAATAKLREKSAICLWSALSYYGLTDEVPSKVWCILPWPYGYVQLLKSII